MTGVCQECSTHFRTIIAVTLLCVLGAFFISYVEDLASLKKYDELVLKYNELVYSVMKIKPEIKCACSLENLSGGKNQTRSIPSD